LKLEFNKKVRDDVEAVGGIGAIKKDNHTQLKLPELGKLEACATLKNF